MTVSPTAAGGDASGDRDVRVGAGAKPRGLESGAVDRAREEGRGTAVKGQGKECKGSGEAVKKWRITVQL